MSSLAGTAKIPVTRSVNVATVSFLLNTPVPKATLRPSTLIFAFVNESASNLYPLSTRAFGIVKRIVCLYSVPALNLSKSSLSSDDSSSPFHLAEDAFTLPPSVSSHFSSIVNLLSFASTLEVVTWPSGSTPTTGSVVLS